LRALSLDAGLKLQSAGASGPLEAYLISWESGLSPHSTHGIAGVEPPRTPPAYCAGYHTEWNSELLELLETMSSIFWLPLANLSRDDGSH
jgi:hypothetical protein